MIARRATSCADAVFAFPLDIGNDTAACLHSSLTGLSLNVISRSLSEVAVLLPMRTK